MSGTEAPYQPPWKVPPGLPPAQRTLGTKWQSRTEDYGWGTVEGRLPPWLEAGASGEFEFITWHKTDGNFDPASAVLTILDSTGATVTAATVSTAVKRGTGDWYYEVKLPTTQAAGQYNAQYVGTYSAKDGNTITLQFRMMFRVKVTKKKSAYVFKRSDQS